MDIEIVHDASLEAEMEQRVKIDSIRDDSKSIFVGDKKVGKITGYKFKILVRDSPAFEGVISREEMETIYRLYTNEGAKLTRRAVSREFADKYTPVEFNRIIRAFNITKDSSPLAPHIIEERSIDDLIKLSFQTKERDLAIQLEQNRSKINEIRVKELLKDNFDLKKIIEEGAHFISDIDFTPVKFFSSKISRGNSIVVYLADMHIGAYNSTEGVYDNPYNEDEVIRRLTMVYNRICQIPYIDKITIINMGDALDGFNAQTTRSASTHLLPQNQTNKEQAKTFIKVMVNFFTNIINTISCNDLNFYSVSESNHGGDYEAGIVMGLSYLLEQMGITCHVAAKPIDHFTSNNRTFIYLHGKDNQNQFKNFPLTLDIKTELYMNEYIRKNNIDGKITVVKGDLHQSAITKGKQFTYHSVASLFGSSNWIHANFGFTPWGCDYAILDTEGNIINGLIED